MGSTRLTIISADTHAGADIQGYRPYLDSSWHNDFDVWARGFESAWLDADDDDFFLNFDSERRMAALEADGISAEVVFPNTYPPFFPGRSLAGAAPETATDYARQWAGLQAHNRWVVDFCAATPGRRKAVIQILPNVVDDAVAEIQWAARHPEICGALLSSVPPNTVAPLYDASYDRLWAACVDAGLPVASHAGSGAPALPDHPATMPILVYEYAFWSHRTIWHLIFGGVFERFPDLQFAITEQGGCKWLGALARGLDEKLDTLIDPEKQTVKFDRSSLATQTQRPSDALAQNCWLGASFLQAHDVPHRHDVALERIMWGADFPHNEGTTPHTREALRAALCDVPVDEVRSIVGGAAARLYGFDLERLAPIAERVGPTVDEIATPLDEVPQDATSYAFLPEYQATY
ncbi:MAG: amidohydrolase family protein [Acidimicrobiales bacterium]|nr:amidohydrolase family protein [Acidimicrobiales bacterium]